MDGFLNNARAKLASLDAYHEVVVVLGNEACDLDSAVSAICYAFFLDHTVYADSDAAVLPIMNIKESEFRLRTEVSYWLNAILLPETLNSLIFKSDMDFQRLTACHQNFQLHLVDHNQLAPTDSFLKHSVVDILDHHDITEQYDTTAVQLTVEKVGSCCTLVAERLLTYAPLLLDTIVAQLLLGPILVDTVCLSDEAGKVTPKDKSILQQLLPYVPDFNQQRAFDDLMQAKANVSSLSFEDLLLKDCKCLRSRFMTVLLSSLPVQFEAFQNKVVDSTLTDALTSFCAEQTVDVIIISTYFPTGEGQFARQVAVFSPNFVYLDQIVSVLLDPSTVNLGLQWLPSPADNINLFTQTRVQYSRKQILPLINDFMQGFGAPSQPLHPDPPKPPKVIPSEPLPPEHLPLVMSRSFGGSASDKPIAATGADRQRSSSTSSTLSHSTHSSRRNSPRSFLDGPGLDRSFSVTYEDLDSPTTDHPVIGLEPVDEGASDELTLDDTFDEFVQRHLPSLNTAGGAQLTHSPPQVYEQRTESVVSSDSGIDGSHHHGRQGSQMSQQQDFGSSQASDDVLSPLDDQRETALSVNPSVRPPIAEIDKDASVLPLVSIVVESPSTESNCPTSPAAVSLSDNCTAAVMGFCEQEGQNGQGIEGTNHAAVAEWEEEYPELLDIKKSEVDGRVLSDTVAFDSLPTTSQRHIEDEVASRHDSTSTEGPDETTVVGDFEWDDDAGTSVPNSKKPTYTSNAQPRWLQVTIMGHVRQIDTELISPYMPVISDGGYCVDEKTGIIVFTACYLPDRSHSFYDSMMDNLFLYVVSVLDHVVADEYVIVYLQGGVGSSKMPSIGWLRRCYHMIDRRHVSHIEPGLDRRLRKNLKALYLVHPTLWLKTVVTMASPFMNWKFTRKVHYVRTLRELSNLVPLNNVIIPTAVREFERMHCATE